MTEGRQTLLYLNGQELTLRSVVSAIDIEPIISSLPDNAKCHLDKHLDHDNEGVDRDLNAIADKMEDWKVKIATHLRLTPIDMSDIELKYPQQPVLQRYVIMT